MTPGIARLLFDECLSKPFLDRLIEFVKPKDDGLLIINHILDFVQSGDPDEVWVPRFKDEGWTVISSDGGRKPNKNRGKKLPQLCTDYGITLILLSPAVHNRKSIDKTRTILSVWDEILACASDQSRRGSRYMIEPRDQNSPGIGRITERPIRPTGTASREGG